MKKQKRIKVLLMIADVGGGHRAPAEAIQQVMETKHPGRFHIEIMDLYTVADVAPFNTSESSYKLVTQNWTFEKINNLVFRLTNSFYSWFEQYVWNRMHSTTLEILQAEAPDIVLCNQPIVSTAVHSVKKEWDTFFYVSQITDTEVFLKGCMDLAADLVIAPTFEAYKSSRMHGVDKKHIIYPYFSLKPSLGNTRKPEKILEELQFSNSKPIIFLTGGGVGIKSMQQAIAALSKHDGYQIVVSAGKMQSAKKKLERTYRKNPNVRVIGFVNNIQDYYSVADVVVTKPGMSSMMEAFVFNKKCILTHPVAMQEVGNVKYALQNPNFRFVDRQWDKLPNLVDELLNLETNPHSAKDYPARSLLETEIIVDTIISRFEQWQKRRQATSLTLNP